MLKTPRKISGALYNSLLYFKTKSCNLSIKSVSVRRPIHFRLKYLLVYDRKCIFDYGNLVDFSILTLLFSCYIHAITLTLSILDPIKEDQNETCVHFVENLLYNQIINQS